MDARIIIPAFHFTAVERGTRQAVLAGWLGVRQQLTAPAWQAARRQMSRPLYPPQLTPAVANLAAKNHKWPQRPQTRRRRRQGKMYHLLMKSSRRRVIKASCLVVVVLHGPRRQICGIDLGGLWTKQKKKGLVPNERWTTLSPVQGTQTVTTFLLKIKTTFSHSQMVLLISPCIGTFDFYKSYSWFITKINDIFKDF